MNRNVLIALGVFVVLLSTVVVLRNRDPRVGVRELKVEKIDGEKMTRIEVTLPQKDDKPAAGPDAGAAASSALPPKVVVLEKNGAGWQVSDASAPDKKYTVDDAQMKQVVDAANELLIGDLISSKKEKLKELEIDDDKGSVVKITTDGKPAVELVFGRPAKGGGNTVRQRGSDDVFVTKGRLGALLKKDVSAWRKKTLFDVKADDITQVVTALADGSTYTLAATTPAAPEAAPDAGPAPAPKPEWSLKEPATLPAGFRLDTTVLARSASGLAGLRAADFADGVTDDVAGFATAHATVTATTKDGKTLAVHIGKEDDKKRLYARVDGDKQVYLLPSYAAKQVMRSLDDLRDMGLLSGNVDDVERATFKGSTTITVAKAGAEWKLVEPKTAPAGFDIAQVPSVIASVLRTKAARLAPADVAAGATGLDKATPSVDLVFKGGKKASLRFGGGVPGENEKAPEVVAPGQKLPPLQPKEYYVKGSVDDRVYVVASFARNRFDKTVELFKKPEPPPDMGGGGMPGMDKLPPDVRKKLEESMRNGNLPGGQF